MKLDVRHLSLLRSQGILAARAAMSRPRQAAIGMVTSLVIAGQLSGLHGGLLQERRATFIQPTAVDYARAVDEGFYFPLAETRRDAAISVARREATTLLAGFAGTITVAAAAAPDVAAVNVEIIDTGLPKTIVQSDTRIARPAHRSKTGETVSDSVLFAFATASAPVEPSDGDMAAISEGSDADPASEIKAAMLRLSSEAHSNVGRPALSSQAISDYLSLYAMRQRVAEIGEAFVKGDAEADGGAWVVNFGSGLDDALFQSGFASGETSFSAMAGVDGVTRGVLSEGDQLTYGGFAGAFKLSTPESATPLPLQTRGGTIGLFAVLDDGPFSVTAMLRADFSEGLDGLRANQLDFSNAMQVLKAEVVARYRFAVSDWTVEPHAGLSYMAGRRELAGLTPATARIEEADSLKFQLGVKASGIVYNRSGTSVEPSVTITIAEELRESGDVAFLSGAPNAAAEPARGKTVGAVSFGVDLKDDSGWTGFVRADGQVSDEDKPSAGVSAGVKTQW